jgi:hypothetical protein
MFLLVLHGKQYLGDSPQGPWTLRELTESQQSKEPKRRVPHNYEREYKRTRL